MVTLLWSKNQSSDQCIYFTHDYNIKSISQENKCEKNSMICGTLTIRSFVSPIALCFGWYKVVCPLFSLAQITDIYILVSNCVVGLGADSQQGDSDISYR